MIDWIIWIVLGVLGLASFLDLKYKAVPSVILTGSIFTVLFLRPDNLYIGVLAFVFAFLIRDLINDVAGMDFGVADIKIITIIGLLLVDLSSFMLFILLFVIFQMVYTILWRWKVAKEGNMAFVPCLLAVYIVLVVLEAVA